MFSRGSRERSRIIKPQTTKPDPIFRPLVEELDRAIPEEGAKISFRQYGGGPDESMIAGTRLGLLRVGVEFLRTGMKGPTQEKGVYDLSGLRDVTHSESEYRFDYFEEKTLPEDLSEEAKNERTAKAIGIGLLVVVIVTLLLAGYGCARLFS